MLGLNFRLANTRILEFKYVAIYTHLDYPTKITKLCLFV